MSTREYLFCEPSIGSPLEELREVYEKRWQTSKNLGEDAKAELYRAAHELARSRLASILEEGE
jgi:hypothetical protein